MKKILSFVLLVSLSVFSVRASQLPSGAVATWGDGTPLLTQQELDNNFEFQVKAQPQLQSIPEAMVSVFKENLCSALVAQKVIAKWVSKNNIDKTNRYKTKLKNIVEAVMGQLNAEYFLVQFEYVPTDEELTAFYEKNKDRIALKKDGTLCTFEELKEQVKTLVIQAKQQEEAVKMLQELKEEYGVQVDEDVFAPKDDEQKK